MLPTEVSMLLFALQIWESEKLYKFGQELLKQKVWVDAPLNVVWQLVKKFMVLLSRNWQIPVVVPLVFEKVLDYLLQLRIHVFAVIKALY